MEDKNLVQALLIMRLFVHNCSINISTREGKELRKNLIPLGVTKMSAGVSTEVGGHTKDIKEKGEAQFVINDESSTEEVRKMIIDIGYHPIFKDWERI